MRDSLRSTRASFEPGRGSLPEEEYFLQRSVALPHAPRVGELGRSDAPGRAPPAFAELRGATRGPSLTAPSPLRNSSAVRASSAMRNSSAVHVSTRVSAHAQNMHIEAQDMRGVATRAHAEKESLKFNYEEFIRRLQAENEELKRAEQRLLQVSALKRGLEIELTQVASQLAVYHNSGDDPLVERLKRMVNELHAEKAELRRQLEHNKMHINELVTQVTTVRHAGEGEAGALRTQLAALQTSYNRLVEDYRAERGRPIQVPDNAELRRLLEEKVSIIESLQARIRFMDDQLRLKSAPCALCPAKDAALGHLQGRVRELELREQRRSTSYLPARTEVVRSFPAVAARPERMVESHVRSSSAARLNTAHGCCSTICISVPCNCACSPGCSDCGECCAEGRRGQAGCVSSSSHNMTNSTNVTETITTSVVGGAPGPQLLPRVVTAPAGSAAFVNEAFPPLRTEGFRPPSMTFNPAQGVPEPMSFTSAPGPARTILARESPRMHVKSSIGAPSASVGGYSLSSAPAARYTQLEPLVDARGYSPRPAGLTAAESHRRC